MRRCLKTRVCSQYWHCFHVRPIECPFLPNHRHLLPINLGVYFPPPQGDRDRPRAPLFEDRPESNISWIKLCDSSLVPRPEDLSSVWDMKPCLITLFSPQSIVWAELFPLPTEQKLLKLKTQEDSFSLAFCSVISSQTQ